MASPLYDLFVKLFEMGRIPTAWKAGNITPIHKKGSKVQVENYRPISLTSVVSKCMEKIVRSRQAVETHDEQWNTIGTTARICARALLYYTAAGGNGFVDRGIGGGGCHRCSLPGFRQGLRYGAACEDDGQTAGMWDRWGGAGMDTEFSNGTKTTGMHRR